MGQIKVNIETLENKIQKLRELVMECEEINIDAEPVSGAGESINMLTNIDNQYKSLKTTFLTLLGNSIAFFENIKNSELEADEEAAAKIK